MTSDFLDVIPVLPCRDIPATHDYLLRVLGFESGGLVDIGGGHVVHGEVRAGDRRFWLHEAAGGLTTPADAGARTGGNVVHVADVDAHFARATAEGAEIIREPTDENYGQREYCVRDLDGHDWYIATPTQQPAAR